MNPAGAIKSCTTIVATGYDKLVKFISKRPVKGEIRLDFMSSVIRIAAIGLCEINSRISVEKNKIIIQPYSSTLGFERFLRQDKRDQLGELILPICTALVVYPPETTTLQTIYKACRVGFETLIKTYTSHMSFELRNTDLTFQALNSCVQFINQQIDIHEKKIVEEKGVPTSFQINQFLYSESLRTTIKKSDLWTQPTLEACERILTEADRVNKKGDIVQKDSYLKSLLAIADGKDIPFTILLKGL